MLPVALPAATVQRMLENAAGPEDYTISVDLEKQLVIEPDGSSSGFEVDSFRKTFLLKGLDEIGWTLQYETDIAKYERSQDSG